MIAISALTVYPLKGGRGIDLREMELDAFGPRHDRRWMVVDLAGDLVTQREVPRLCLTSATPLEDGIRLDAPGQPSLEIAHPGPGAPRVAVRVWNDRCDAVDLGSDARRWLQATLGVESRLVHLPADASRRTDPDYDPLGSLVSFADGYPILLVGDASLAELNSRLATPVPMNRFRPNVVVTGAAAFAEDGWRRFRVGGVPFEAVKPCARCTVPTVDQETGLRGAEPLRTLATFRKRASAVLFGMNVVHRSQGAIRRGDPLVFG